MKKLIYLTVMIVLLSCSKEKLSEKNYLSDGENQIEFSNKCNAYLVTDNIYLLAFVSPGTVYDPNGYITDGGNMAYIILTIGEDLNGTYRCSELIPEKYTYYSIGYGLNINTIKEKEFIFDYSNILSGNININLDQDNIEVSFTIATENKLIEMYFNGILKISDL